MNDFIDYVSTEISESLSGIVTPEQVKRFFTDHNIKSSFLINIDEDNLGGLAAGMADHIISFDNVPHQDRNHIEFVVELSIKFAIETMGDK